MDGVGGVFLWLVILANTALAAAQVECPLDFSALGSYPCVASRLSCETCSDIWNRLNFVIAEHVRRTGKFLLDDQPQAKACLASFSVQLESKGARIMDLNGCGIVPSILLNSSRSCPNIVTEADYKKAMPNSTLDQMTEKCGNFSSLSTCGQCYAAATGASLPSNDSNCLNYSYIYASAVVNRNGPLDKWVAFCLFSLIAGKTSRRSKKHLVLVTALVSSSLLLGASVFGLVFYYQSIRKRKKVEDIEIPNALEFRIDELSAATNGFRTNNCIGSGGFGNVYRGVLANGTCIAVKRLKNASPAGAAEFVNEVEAIGSVRHKNLVPLLGWCVNRGDGSSQGHQRFIIYEFMKNGSLQEFLGSQRQDFPWRMKKKVVLDIARGLAYLHFGINPRIFHRDVKLSNVLLDDDYNARISDLGLARMIPDSGTSVMTGVVGTKGYIPPEYLLYEQLTDRTDVYGFGVVTLEIITGMKALVPPLDNPLAEWIWDAVEQGRSRELISKENDSGVEEMVKLLRIGLICSHPYAAERPSMARVVKMLEDDTLTVVELPKRPDSIVSSSSRSSRGSYSNSMEAR